MIAPDKQSVVNKITRNKKDNTVDRKEETQNRLWKVSGSQNKWNLQLKSFELRRQSVMLMVKSAIVSMLRLLICTYLESRKVMSLDLGLINK